MNERIMIFLDRDVFLRLLEKLDNCTLEGIVEEHKHEQGDLMELHIAMTDAFCNNTNYESE